MRKMKLILKGILLFALITCSVNAAPLKWEVDPAHSGIYFDIRHMFSTVRGQFEHFSGKMMIDEEDPSASTVSFEVKVDSVNTNIEERDAHLKGKDFFEVDKFPVMKFKSTSVKHVKDRDYLLEGNLTIKGITRKMTLPFKYLGKIENPMKPGAFVSGFECKFTINRLDYNVGDESFYKKGLIAKDVDITITLELAK